MNKLEWLNLYHECKSGADHENGEECHASLALDALLAEERDMALEDAAYHAEKMFDLYDGCINRIPDIAKAIRSLAIRREKAGGVSK